VRLPDPLRQPHPARAHAELLHQKGGEPLDLSALVAIGQHGEDRLVEPAREELDLAAGDRLAEQIEGRARVLAKPREQAPGAVDAQPQLAAPPDELEERPVRALRRLDQHRVEVSDRLMVVHAEAEGQPIRLHGALTRDRDRGARASG
jgi:hypothetical protein